ncbi:MAG TPA: FtsX-like permease family protein [Lacipirellulaceae bacterium]|nr:FtsX-like permease family protein [Lacipirellulaceae bacterium]
MKYLPLIFRNVLRNKIRSLFTAASIAMSLFLVVMLYSFLTVQDQNTSASLVYNRLIAMNVQGLTGNVPISYVDRIKEIEGVRAATPFSWFGGRYREEKIPFGQFGVDPQSIAVVYEDYQLPPEQLKAFQEDRTGCVVGALIAKNKGWKIGDKIPLKGDIYPVNLELTVRGIYDGPSSIDREMLWFNFTYLDELLKQAKDPNAGNAGIVVLRATNDNVLDRLANDVETRFASSDAPVKALTEKQFQAEFLSYMGDVKGFIRYTSIAIVVALLCVAGNTMAMALRERTREIALFKAIGFSQTTVLGLFLSEAVAIGALGGIVGCLGGKLLFATVDFSKAMPGLGWLYVPWSTALAGVALAAGVGFLSGIIPAWRAAHLNVVDGLRKVV